MAEYPGVFQPKDFQEAIRQVQQLIDDLYSERLGGANVGDVFAINNQSDTLTLQVWALGGLQKLNGALAILPSPTGCIILTSAGVDASLASTTKKGVVPQLPNDATKFFDGVGAWAVPSGSGTPAATVTDETSWGITPAVGTDDTYAREDHTHGSPANPLTGGVASHTITLAKLTALGANGSLTITNGLITAYTDPT